MNDFGNFLISYIEKVNIGLLEFERLIGQVHPLKAWRNKTLPQKGELSSEISYEFHGIGCLLIFQDCEVDFDFSSEARNIGFDLWRLSKYSDSFKNNPYYSNKAALRKDFDDALAADLIKKSPEKNCKLYFLATGTCVGGASR